MFYFNISVSLRLIALGATTKYLGVLWIHCINANWDTIMAQATFAQSCEIIKIIQNEFVSNQTIAGYIAGYMLYVLRWDCLGRKKLHVSLTITHYIPWTCPNINIARSPRLYIFIRKCSALVCYTCINQLPLSQSQ